MKERIGCGKAPPLPQLARVETEPDYEEVLLDEWPFIFFLSSDSYLFPIINATDICICYEQMVNLITVLDISSLVLTPCFFCFFWESMYQVTQNLSKMRKIKKISCFTCELMIIILNRSLQKIVYVLLYLNLNVILAHYYWFNAKIYKYQKPSLTIRSIVKLLIVLLGA